ncbi:hypothetical protein ABZU75_23445 [Streptosporangium sp. NPDC005286]|uniref:hypothetical protein n=1 Tax=Streptosporangium sp. NPDC005286 TaxID=3154463 RepID=UPI0033A0F9D6
MSSETATEWPAGVLARYLTVGGATVDIREVCGYHPSSGHTAPTTTVATCTGCGKREARDWTQQIWCYSTDRLVEETDEGGKYTTPKVRDWAQSHAEKCRAMPKPNQT